MIQTQGTKPSQILYLARGTHERYAVARSQVPPGFANIGRFHVGTPMQGQAL